MVFLKNDLPKKRGTPEERATSVLEGSTRRTDSTVTILSGHYLKSYSENRGKFVHTKIVTLDLDSPRQELSARRLGFVVSSPSGSLARLINSARLLGVHIAVGLSSSCFATV